jgi:hypothetical protein
MNISTKPVLLMLLGYFLLGLIGSLVLRAARDAHRGNLPAQEHVVRAYLTALAIADVCFSFLFFFFFCFSEIILTTH